MKTSKKDIGVIFICVILSVSSIFLGVVCAKKIKGINVGQSVEIEMDDSEKINKVNFLLLGLDGDGSRSDSIMFVEYDNKTKKLKILSIPRDTRVRIGNNFQKINAAIGIGRQEASKGKIKEPEELAIKKVKELVRLPIHYFMSVDFKGFRKIIDVLDGVDFNVPDVEGNGRGMNYDDPAQNLKIHLKPGFQHLNGIEAEELVRYRKYNEADIARIRTQQQFMKEILQQKLKPQYLTKIRSIYEEVQNNVRSNYTVFDLAKHIGIIKELKAENFESFQYPGESQIISGVWYFLPDIKEGEKLINEHFRN